MMSCKNKSNSLMQQDLDLAPLVQFHSPSVLTLVAAREKDLPASVRKNYNPMATSRGASLMIPAPLIMSLL